MEAVSPGRKAGGFFFRSGVITPPPRRITMATKPVTAKLRLRLELIAALPEPIMLDRLGRLSVAELIAFRRMYGIRECRCKGRCKVEQFGELRATRMCVAEGRSRRLAARLLREVRNNPISMYQTRCQCGACRQAIPPIPFSVHQLLANMLVPEGETAPRPPRTRPNLKRRPLSHAA
jgi:hypothetical protein